MRGVVSMRNTRFTHRLDSDRAIPIDVISTPEATCFACHDLQMHRPFVFMLASSVSNAGPPTLTQLMSIGPCLAKISLASVVLSDGAKAVWFSEWRRRGTTRSAAHS